MMPIKTAIAVNRFGLGARPGDAARLGDEADSWLLDQCAPNRSVAPSANVAGSAAVLARAAELRAERQAAQRQQGAGTDARPDAARQAYAEYVGDQYRAQAAATFRRAIESDEPFHERLVAFWSNHFAVSADKQAVRPIAGLYADEAIRPHVTDNFRTLLRAAVGHPAMLLYLDNAASIGPDSLLGRRANRNRQVGLNENLAREILELHTLGVDGGYNQDDVIELSRILTGWSVGGQGAGARQGALINRLGGRFEPATPGGFDFRDAIHEPGPKRLLGRRFAEAGLEEGEAALDFLASRPETARFIATKLARHFVADDPPAGLVDRMTSAYLEHEGELAEVYSVLVLAPESWREPQAKYKTPQDFLVSAGRAVGVPAPDHPFVALATELGQRPLTPGSPAGWPDTAPDWNSGDSLLKRIDWAVRAGRALGDRIDAVARLDEILGETASTATRETIARAESGAQAVTLLLSAPEFQRR